MSFRSCLFSALLASLGMACSSGSPAPQQQYVGNGEAGGSASISGGGGAIAGNGGSTDLGAGGSSSNTGGETTVGGVGGSLVEGAGGSIQVGAGGSETAGGGGSIEGATGGSPATTVSRYEHGFAPATITVEDARAAYESWKTVHLENCNGGVYRVRWENAKLDATVSEGIGYGMLLTVAFGDREAFDGLYAYYNLALNQGSAGGMFGGGSPATGLMHWLRYGCDAHRDTKYSDYPDGAAADADLDVAMSLIQADCKWGGGNYASEATKVIGNIRQHMFGKSGNLELLLPGDSSWFAGMGDGCINYSYFAPAYYREFAKYETAQASFWNKAADDSYTLLSQASNGSTGLVRNWGSANGSDAYYECHDAYNRAASYGDDAARTPWRVATDYLWNGTPAAKSWNDKVTTWVKTVGIAQTLQWYKLDGSADTEASTYDDHTVINVGPWAVGAMTYDQATVDTFAAEVIAIPSGPNDHDGEYFSRMLKGLSLLTLAGHFDVCGGDLQ